MRHPLDWFSGKTGIVLVDDWLTHPETPDVITLALPGYRQTNTFACGFTAACMVVHHFYPRRSINRLYELVRPDTEMGTSTARLKQALRKSGLAVQERDDLKWTDIHRAIESNCPVIVKVTTRKPDVLHWCVIYGTGKKPNRVFLAGVGTPLIGRKEFSFFEFSAAKWETRGFGLICRKQQGKLAAG